MSRALTLLRDDTKVIFFFLKLTSELASATFPRKLLVMFWASPTTEKVTKVYIYNLYSIALIMNYQEAKKVIHLFKSLYLFLYDL